MVIFSNMYDKKRIHIVNFLIGKIKRSIFEKYGPIIKEDDFRRAFVTLVYVFFNTTSCYSFNYIL